MGVLARPVVRDKMDNLFLGSPYKVCCLSLAADNFRNSYLHCCISSSKDSTDSECILMSRQKPPRKGKPFKTEAGFIRPLNKDDKTDQPQMNKLDEIE
jgi:hypothetical protein